MKDEIVGSGYCPICLNAVNTCECSELFEQPIKNKDMKVYKQERDFLIGRGFGLVVSQHDDIFNAIAKELSAYHQHRLDEWTDEKILEFAEATNELPNEPNPDLTERIGYLAGMKAMRDKLKDSKE